MFLRCLEKQQRWDFGSSGGAPDPKSTWCGDTTSSPRQGRPRRDPRDIRAMDKVAIDGAVLTNREHIREAQASRRQYDPDIGRLFDDMPKFCTLRANLILVPPAGVQRSDACNVYGREHIHLSRSLFRVLRVVLTVGRSLPVFPQLRTCRRSARTDAMCHERTLTERRIVPLGSNPVFLTYGVCVVDMEHPSAPRPLTPPRTGVHAWLARAFEAVSATNLVSNKRPCRALSIRLTDQFGFE
jgi:hypothetical protein